MIVRDEAASLARAISSFGGVADEVVVVDTGSTDDTVAVAASLGARVVHHIWQDDFSAARMAGFAAATGEWAFALDADERLLPECRGEVRRLVEQPTAEAYLVTRRDLNAHGYAEMHFVRLGWIAGRRMVGRIHERVEPPFDRVGQTEIVIEHDGYLPGRNDARLRRNVRLLELELRDDPGHAYYLADLTQAYCLLGDPRWSATLGAAFRTLDLAAPRAPIPLAAILLEITLAAGEGSLPPGVTPRLADELAARWYPDSVPLLVARARLAFGRGDFPQAADLGERAVRTWESGRYDRTISFDPGIVGAELRLNLGVALAQTGRLDEALVRFDEAVGDRRFTRLAEQNAAAIRAEIAKRMG